MNRREDRAHLLKVLEAECEIIHWPDCPTEVLGLSLGDDPGSYERYCCMTGALWDEGGWDWLGEPLEPGLYAVQAWSTPGGWAGAHPIDPDAGFDVFGPLPRVPDAV